MYTYQQTDQIKLSIRDTLLLICDKSQERIYRACVIRVRGPMLDALTSSMPELFSGIFFVIIAIRSARESGGPIADAGGEGIGATIATCAGSTVYNLRAVYRSSNTTRGVIHMAENDWKTVFECRELLI